MMGVVPCICDMGNASCLKWYLLTVSCSLLNYVSVFFFLGKCSKPLNMQPAFEGKAKLPLRCDEYVIIAYGTNKGGATCSYQKQVVFLLSLFQRLVSSVLLKPFGVVYRQQ